MARLGIDFGTTNTVVMHHDRGVISEVLHSVDTGAGTIVQAIYPSAILVDNRTGECWFGIEAERRSAQIDASGRYLYLPSLKSRLRHYSESATAATNADDPIVKSGMSLADLLRGYLASLAESIRGSQSVDADEPLEAVITWPANANGAQRYITRRCFRDAGFNVIDTINEPTAAAIELADCLTGGRAKNKEREPSAMAVFDLGGGTFDASVVWVEGTDFQVLTSAGIENLGGDNFDTLLADMFIEKMKIQARDINATMRQAMVRHARSQKETISSGISKRLHVSPKDFGFKGRAASVRIDDYLDQIKPLIRPAIKTLKDVISSARKKESRIRTNGPMTIYLVGGSSKLPIVSSMVSEAFPKDRVILTDKPFRAVAMGAAICAGEGVSYRDVFSRHFGLIRLRDHGRIETFDTIFPAGTPIPRRGQPPLVKVAEYHPRHNIGHLRYLECTSIDMDGMPTGSVRTWSDIHFPYDPGVSLTSLREDQPIVATDAFADAAVSEIYRCDSDGVITVELKRDRTQESHVYEVFKD